MSSMRNIRGRSGLLVLAAFPSVLSAQTTVTGMVIDSLTGQSFAGATVQLVPTATPWVAGFSVLSDSAGHYRIADAPAGHYLLGFQHPRLDSLGMDMVSRKLEIRANRANLRADLALPSARTLATALCREQHDTTGVFVGRVLDAVSGVSVARGSVLVQWGEVRVDGGRMSSGRSQVTANVGRDGKFVACNVPMDVPILVSAMLPDTRQAGITTRGARSGEIELSFGYDTPLLHRDLLVAAEETSATDSADSPGARGDNAALHLRRGTARLVGRVMNDDGQPVAGARVSVSGADGLATTDSSGTFRLSGLPIGTHRVDVTALGYAPANSSANLRPEAEAVVTVRTTRRVQSLSEVSVRDAAVDHSGFLRRRRLYSGTFLTADDLERKHAFSVGEALINVPGLRYVGIDPTTMKPAIGGRFGCGPRVYLDGLAVGLSYIDSAIGISQIGGIEVYANQSDAPPQYAGPAFASTGEATKNLGGGCATVVVWTKSYVR